MSIPGPAAIQELDKEEARLKALLIRLTEETGLARRQLEEIQVARRVWQRIHKQVDEPAEPTTSGTEAEEEDEEQPLTIKDAILRALQAVHPRGFQKAGIETWIEENLKRKINSASLSVMLARLRDKDRAIQNHGNVWFFVPPESRKAA